MQKLCPLELQIEHTTRSAKGMEMALGTSVCVYFLGF